MSEENINLAFGIFIGLVFGVLFSFVFFLEKGESLIEDAVVEKGYGEYVIEEKEIVFKWKENSSFREAK